LFAKTQNLHRKIASTKISKQKLQIHNVCVSVGHVSVKILDLAVMTSSPISGSLSGVLFLLLDIIKC